MNDLNNVNLIGRLTREAELRYSTGGMGICKFSIAVNRSVKKNDRWQDEASFFDALFSERPQRVLSSILPRGSKSASAENSCRIRWEKDGKQMSRVEINVNHVQLVGEKPERQKDDNLPNTPEKIQG